MGSIDKGDVDPRTELLPNLIDHFAKTKPDAIYAEYPVNPMSYDDGYYPVTYKIFANVINGIAKWLTETLGPGNGEILAYVGPNDLRYPALVLGANKANYCIFLTSPRNSTIAHQTLFKRLNCNILLTSTPRPPFIEAILEAYPLKVVEIPDLQTLLTTEYPHFRYSKTYPESANDRIAVVHTSGSTGIPKPIIWTHDMPLNHIRQQRLEPPNGCKTQHQMNFGKRLFLTLPPFHAAGIGFLLFVTVPVGSTLIIPTSTGLPTAAALVAARKQTPFESALVVPSIALELAQDDELLEYCSTHMERIEYAGGDLPQPVGDKVAAKISLMNAYGSSEMGLPTVIHSPNRDPLTDWRYLEFHPEVGFEFRHVSGDEYEAVVVRSPTRQAYQCPFSIFPDLQEFHTNDMMIRHPDPAKPNLWRPSARVDDVIVFLNGEKTNPVSMEQHIVSANPEVTGCLVAGAQRFQATLIVELSNSGEALDANERAAMIERLWPSINHANSATPAHARIAKSHVLFTSPEKPLPRSSKGTIQRPSALKLYAQEIDDIYNDAEKLAQLDATQLTVSQPRGVDDAAKVAEYIRAAILATTKWDSEKLSDEENWFNLGLDSLQAITMTRVLKHGLNLPALTPNVIYLNPSVLGLTNALQCLQKDIEVSAEARQQEVIQERHQLLQELIGQVDSEAQGPSKTAPSEAAPAKQTVLLTGSTGQLGTYLLDTLLQNDQIEHVFCLNRDIRAHDRQHERAAAYDLTAADEKRVSFLTADLSKSNFGLQPEHLQKLQQKVTLIIHNAWTVNFNLPLSSFKPNLLGVVNLINFTRQPETIHSPRLFFISSMSTIIGHHEPSEAANAGLIPECLVTTTTPGPNGYANSKYVAEHLLGHASEKSLAQAAFARVGQVSGPIRTPGLWSRSEWFPSLVLSSIHLGALPDTVGQALDRVDWVPIDLLADILVDLALHSNKPVYHPVNLHPQTWKEIKPFVVEAVQKTYGKKLETILAQEWVLRVRQDIESISTTKDDKSLDEKELQVHLEKNPAAKLLQFFENIVAQTAPESILDTKITSKASEKLQEVDAVKPDWIQKWVHEWSNASQTYKQTVG